MFLVLDTASNNVLAEYETFEAAEQRRIQIIGMNPPLADYIEVVDLDRTLGAFRDSSSRAPQPA